MKKNHQNNRFVIAGGGTGGHVFPALAIGQAIQKRDPRAEIMFVGTKHGIEAKVMPQYGQRLTTLWISGFTRRALHKNVLLPFKLAVSLLQCASLLMRFKPSVVIGTGGYVMGPMLWTAQRSGIPTLIQEQNSYPGYTTRKLANHAKMICAGFEDAKRQLPNADIEVTGNPLRAAFTVLDRAAARRNWPLDDSRRTILVFGGSAGAKSINLVIGQALPAILLHHNLIWQTGKLGVPASVDQALLKQFVQEKKLIVCEFIDDMPGAYAVADVSICRAGAMTLAELTMAALPAILIPYPYATDDHQTANARSVVEAGAAMMIADRELTAELLTSKIQACLNSESVLTDMATRMKSLARPHAADRIAEIAFTLADKP